MNGEISWEDITEQKLKYILKLYRRKTKGGLICAFVQVCVGAVWALLPTPSPCSQSEDLRRIRYIIPGLGFAFRKEA